METKMETIFEGFRLGFLFKRWHRSNGGGGGC